MRVVPGLTVIDPCDATEVMQIVPTIVDVEGLSTSGSCAARCPSSSIPLGIALRWGRPGDSAPGGTSGSSARAS